MGAFADLIHLPEMINKFGPLPTAWSLERKHKIVKKYGNHLFSQSAPSKSCNWDKSVLRDVTCERLYSIPSDEFDVTTSLLSPTAPSKAMLKALRETFGVSGIWADSYSFRLSRDARLSECCRVSVKDAVVFANGDGTWGMGMVRQLLEVTTTSPAGAEHTLLALVSKWDRRRAGAGSSVWETQSLGSHYMRLQAVLRPAACWSHRSADRCVVLHPPGFATFDA